MRIYSASDKGMGTNNSNYNTKLNNSIYTIHSINTINNSNDNNNDSYSAPSTPRWGENMAPCVKCEDTLSNICTKSKEALFQIYTPYF